MISPCRSCPWRTSVRTGDIPGGGLDAAKCGALDHGGGAGLGRVMQCHLGPHACAGFVLRVGYASPALRLAVAWKLVDPDKYTDGGAELYPTFEAMVAAHAEGGGRVRGRTRGALMPKPKPLRLVVDAHGPRQGRCIGNNALSMAWWELTLECGHVVERRVRFPKQVGHARRGFAVLHRPRSIGEALPAPKRVRCEWCPDESA